MVWPIRAGEQPIAGSVGRGEESLPNCLARGVHGIKSTDSLDPQMLIVWLAGEHLSLGPRPGVSGGALRAVVSGCPDGR